MFKFFLPIFPVRGQACVLDVISQRRGEPKIPPIMPITGFGHKMGQTGLKIYWK